MRGTRTSFGLLMLATAIAAAQPYRYHLHVVLDTSPSGSASNTRLEGVNSEGTVVGWSSFSGQPTRSFFWTREDGFTFVPAVTNPPQSVSLTGISDIGIAAGSARVEVNGFFYPRAYTYDIMFPEWRQVHPWAGCSSEMQAMSENGHYCGEVQHLNNGNCGDQFSTGEAFVGDSGNASTIGRLSQWPTWAHDVNNNGDACGEGYLSDGSSVRGYFHLAGGAIQQLPGLGGNWAFAYGLNDNGLVVGYASRPGDNEWIGVKWHQVNGSWVIDDVRNGTTDSLAWDVNNAGQIVGYEWFPALGEAHAVMWIGDQYWDLNNLVENPSGYLRQAKAISQTGWIIGDLVINGGTHSFILEPIDRDSDGDGLLDSWETTGIRYEDTNGVTQHFLLPGADPMHKDLYVELDAMTGMSFPAESVTHLETAFAAAPVTNPDGVDGITIHVQRNETNLPHVSPWMTDGCWPLDFDAVRTARFGTTAERANPAHVNLLEAKAKAYRFGIAADEAAPDRIGGCGQTPGDNFVLFIGNPAYDNLSKAAVFMHELGHNLGLRHGGGDSVNGKPNYPSVMNYVLSYKYPWNTAFWRMDYSRAGPERFASLDEGSLDENAGIGMTGDIYDTFQMPFGVDLLQGDGTTVRSTAYAKLDGSQTDFGDAAGTFYQDGAFGTGVVQDLTYASDGPPGIPGTASPGQSLEPYNDWEHVALPLAATLGATAAAPDYPDDETTDEVRDWIENNFPMPPSECIADFTGDDLLDFFDVQAFLNAFVLMDPAGDMTGDGVFDFFDLQAFLQAFAAGCP